MKTYVFLDVSKKQEFIFRSNKLKDVQYNSFVLKAISEIYSDEDLEVNKNLKLFLRDMSVSLTNSLKLIEFKCDAYISGGGCSYIRFDKEEKAKAFIKKYSKDVLENFPDVELYMSYITVDDEKLLFPNIIAQLREKGDHLKDLRRSRFRRISFGVEELDERGNPLTIESDTTSQSKFYRNAFTELFGNKLKNYTCEDFYEIEYEQDQFKINNDSGRKFCNYIGVISIDGNKMGELVSRVTSFEEYMKLSKEIDAYYAYVVGKSIKKISRMGNCKLKIAPIILAGDDICVIVHAHKSISLAKSILEEIQNDDNLKDFSTIKLLLKKAGLSNLSACGGVSLVKIGYPFFEAVEEAESMCKNSKLASHMNETFDSYLDWSLNKGGKRETQDYSLFLKEMNKHFEYTAKPYPVALSNNSIANKPTLNTMYDRLNELRIFNQYNAETLSTQMTTLLDAMYSSEAIFKIVLQRSKLSDTNMSKWVYFENENTTTYILKDLCELEDLIEEVEIC